MALRLALLMARTGRQTCLWIKSMRASFHHCFLLQTYNQSKLMKREARVFNTCLEKKVEIGGCYNRLKY